MSEPGSTMQAAENQTPSQRRWIFSAPIDLTVFGGARAERARPVGQLHFAHTDLSGLALFEEAFDHGLRAAREVAEALA